MNFQDNQYKPEILGFTTRKNGLKTSVLLIEPKSDLAEPMKIVSDYKTIESIASLDTLQTDRTDNQIWKWFVIFALSFY
jgi:hypothetical protein